MDWMVHTVRPRLNTADWSAEPRPSTDTELSLVLREVERTVGGRRAVGLSYQYRYRSGSVPIYKLLDRGTWEPGGSMVGREFWMRTVFSPSVKRFDSLSNSYSSEWYLPSAVNPNVFQFLPWQSELQGFSMSVSDEGVLVTWATRPAHVRSLFEKLSGTDELAHWHEHCGDLSHAFESSPMEVLWLPGETSETDRFNIYHDVAELVAESLHE